MKTLTWLNLWLLKEINLNMVLRRTLMQKLEADSCRDLCWKPPTMALVLCSKRRSDKKNRSMCVRYLSVSLSVCFLFGLSFENPYLMTGLNLRYGNQGLINFKTQKQQLAGSNYTRSYRSPSCEVLTIDPPLTILNSNTLYLFNRFTINRSEL